MFFLFASTFLLLNYIVYPDLFDHNITADKKKPTKFVDLVQMKMFWGQTMFRIRQDM